MPGVTPIYGFPYPEPSDLVANYPALGQQLAEDIEDVLPTIGGLAPVSPTSIASGGGSASTTNNTTSYSGVTSISLNGVFTSAYSVYRILWELDPSANTSAEMRLRASGSDITTGNYYWAETRTGWNGSGSNSGAPTTNTWRFTSTDGSTLNSWGSFDLYDPNLNQDKAFTGLTVFSQAVSHWSGAFYASTVADGLTMYVASGTITGKISVYGYKA